MAAVWAATHRTTVSWGPRHRDGLPATRIHRARPRGGLLLPSRRRGIASLATSLAAVAAAPVRTASEEAVYEVVLRQAALVEEAGAAAAAGRRTRTATKGAPPRRWAEGDDGMLGWGLLGDAYDRCGEVCAEYGGLHLPRRC